MKNEDWEQLLRQSLAPTVEPEEQLNQSIIHQIEKHRQEKPKYKKRLSATLLAAALLLALSVSAYAATKLLTANQVAVQFGDRLLADAFASADALRIDQSQNSGDYHFTLHGLVSGSGLSEFPNASEQIFPDRTYAVVSISRQDGKPMPDVTDPEYGKDPFFVSPLIKGLEPWKFNIVTMNGSYSEDVINGVMYRLIACDQIEIFADKGVYLAISSGSPFYDNRAFAYDAATGEIHANEDYPGAAVLFDLPLDPSKADPVKAKAYMEEQTKEKESDADAEQPQWVTSMEELRAKVRRGESIGDAIPESIQEVEYDASGNIKYVYEGQEYTTPPKQIFKEGAIGFSDHFSIVVDVENDVHKALLFDRDENGVITGRLVVLDSSVNLEVK
ncbi:hypothetical protein KIH86_00020 [Paenibacillus sp. HN-1]|uniref:hypothetical protein n=1 Tax=Paenibacillus TaxID=44249 RepID=UPI001CA9B803|nr:MULTISPECIES: hypothetical protein [Paenibacillus]MBY9079004.1 hypothetical protein [Paenibacillus sp. CGMCC 1.18879]MBY9082633.1 hypothetical protein [Paenibacillus sinensis]